MRIDSGFVRLSYRPFVNAEGGATKQSRPQMSCFDNDLGKSGATSCFYPSANKARGIVRYRAYIPKVTRPSVCGGALNIVPNHRSSAS